MEEEEQNKRVLYKKKRKKEKSGQEENSHKKIVQERDIQGEQNFFKSNWPLRLIDFFLLNQNFFV